MSRLTPRQVEVLKWIAAGKTNGETAQIIGISVRTVEKHRANIMEKLDIHTIADLAIFYKCAICRDG